MENEEMTNDAAVAWMRKHIFYRGVDGRTEGERVVSERKVYENDEPLYSATTVAELRAEVERLHFELDMLRGNYEQQTAYAITHKGALCYCNSSMRDAYSDETVRADAAERRVAELEGVAGAFLEAADARDNEETSTQYPEHERRSRQYKAARADLESLLSLVEKGAGS